MAAPLLGNEELRSLKATGRYQDAHNLYLQMVAMRETDAVIRYPADGRITIIDGSGGTTSDYTDEFQFSTLAEMEHVLDQICGVVVAWVPPEEEQDDTDE